MTKKVKSLQQRRSVVCFATIVAVLCCIDAKQLFIPRATL